MPYTQIINKIKGCEEKFNFQNTTSFSYERFIEKMRPVSIFNGRGAIDSLYAATFASLAKEVLGNALRDEKNGLRGTNVALDVLLSSFENELMQPLREEGKEIYEIRQLNSFGGMKRKEELEFMIDIVDSFPKSEAEAAEQAYKSGKISIRRMVRFCNGVNLADNPDKKDITKMARYMRALERANESRPFRWRIIHPFRNNAEQREAMAIRTRLSGYDGLSLQIAENAVNRHYDTITLTREELSRNLNFVIERERLEKERSAEKKNKPQPEKENVKVKEVEEKCVNYDKLFGIGKYAFAKQESTNENKNLDINAKQK